jgi:hypothetical protein
MAKMIEKLIAKVVSFVKERAASFYPAFLLTGECLICKGLEAFSQQPGWYR